MTTQSFRHLGPMVGCIFGALYVCVVCARVCGVCACACVCVCAWACEGDVKLVGAAQPLHLCVACFSEAWRECAA